ncbi:MAG: sugar ABC transporter ATP-binding protein, partial [Oscillospiraceae bacterium]|nr:sugar ABC transporter ATP-binding protein [Oscillospiraceae bacterium]
TAEEAATLRAYEGRTITLGVRPENIVEGGDVPITVFSNENLGMNTLVHGHLGGSKAASDKITAKLRGWCNYKEGDVVKVSFTRKHFFDKETTNAIGRES